MICGSSGQLGYDCAQVMGRSYEVVPTDLEELDITDLAAVDKMISQITPDVVINCAAYTNVDECETRQALAWKVNVEGPRNLALGVKKHGGQLIHVSSDYVFDGTRGAPEPYVEEDEPNPLSYYGKTKLESELAVREITERHIILRAAWMYGVKGHNFLKTMLRLALENSGKEIKVVNDQYGSPTWSYRLSLQMAKLVETGGQGTYHATAKGHCSWYEMACYFLERMGVAHSLTPCTTEEYPTPASRPRNSILENRHLRENGVDLMPHWQTDLDQFVSLFATQLMREAG